MIERDGLVASDGQDVQLGVPRDGGAGHGRAGEGEVGRLGVKHAHVVARLPARRDQGLWKQD